MMPRSVSATASTIAWRTPSARSLSSAARIAAEPGRTASSGTSPTLCAVWRASTRTRLASRHRGQRMVAHAGFGQQHVADEQMAEEDGAAVLGEGRAVDRVWRRARRAAHRRPGRYCRSSVESKVEQYLKKKRRSPAACSQASAASDWAIASLAAIERVFSATTTASASGIAACRRHADRLDGAHAALDQHARDVGGAGEVVGDHSKHQPWRPPNPRGNESSRPAGRRQTARNSTYHSFAVTQFL